MFTLMTDDVVNINPNSWYDCKVTYNPQTGKIKAYLNNVLVSQWTDTQPLQSGNSISLRSGGTNVLFDDVKVWKSHAPNSNELITIGNPSAMVRHQNNGVNNPSCRIKSMAKDMAENWSTDATLNVNIDWSVPNTSVVIYDGLFADINTFNIHTQISGNWLSASDVHSSIASYEYAIGTNSLDSNIVSWTNNANNLFFTHIGLNLAYNQMYYVSVRAINGAGLKSSIISSDGQYLTPLVQAATASFSQQTNTVCLNDSLQLINSSQNANAWLWQLPGGSPASSALQHPKVLYAMAGTYPVTLIAYSPGGNDTITQNINISHQLLPQIGFSVNDTILFFPSPFLAITNNSQNANSYLWNFGDGNFSNDVSPWHTYSQTGVFTLTVIATNNFCPADTQQITIYVNSPIGMNEYGLNDYNVFPNPSNGILYIDAKQYGAQPLQCKVYDITGKLIYSCSPQNKSYNNHTSFINLGNLPDGLYFITLDENYRTKIIIQK